MFLLDTNMLALLSLKHPLVVRLTGENFDISWISSVTAEEALVGRMNGINKARAPRGTLSLPLAHEDFANTLENLRVLPIYVYSSEAEVIYQTFNTKQTRLGKQDCRIAAQAMAHGFTVVTRNLRDFDGIGATCVDWSKQPSKYAP